jgi:kinesin family protein C1
VTLFRGAAVGSQRHKWTFDKSFPMATTQEEIFAEVSEFVQSALDGYNVCLFSCTCPSDASLPAVERDRPPVAADGQTGSGKTHTMQGYGRGEMSGIIPRAIEQIGRYRDQVSEKGWVYSMQVTFIEIYNEVVYDLLRVEGSEKESLDIKQDARGKTYVAVRAGRVRRRGVRSDACVHLSRVPRNWTSTRTTTRPSMTSWTLQPSTDRLPPPQ